MLRKTSDILVFAYSKFNNYFLLRHSQINKIVSHLTGLEPEYIVGGKYRLGDINDNSILSYLK